MSWFRRKPIVHQMLTLPCGCRREVVERQGRVTLIGQLGYCSRHITQEFNVVVDRDQRLG